MKKYAKIIDEKLKKVIVATGTNESFYKSLEMTEQDVEKGWDGNWYLKGFAPEKPDEITAEEVRAKRNTLLSETDKFMTIDYPITDEEKQEYIKYREYLRNIPERKDFPNLELLDFKDWLVESTNNKIE